MQSMRWVRQHKAPIAIGFVTITLLIIASIWFWGVLVEYIDPKPGPKGITNRKDVVQAFALVAAGVVGLIGGAVGIANWATSRRNLQQQRDLEEQRAQEDALQAYFEQMGGLLTDQDLISTEREDLRQLARAQSHTVLARLDGPRKGALLRFLYAAELISKHRPIVRLDRADLYGADLRRATLSNANLREANLGNADLSSRANLQKANLSRAHLREANLSNADLSEADLRGAYLFETNLSRANLSKADLREAKGWTSRQLNAAYYLKGATMPDGQKYEDWLKEKGQRR